MARPAKRKEYAKKARAFAASLLAALMVAIAACSAPVEAVPTKPALLLTPPSSPTPTPYVSPPVFGGIKSNGDKDINDWVLEGLAARTYEFDDAPTVLIYHTHATEAFRQKGKYKYKESAEWRTEDNEKNIVRVGAELAEFLADMGFTVIHDTANVEPPELASAYSRSLEIMESYANIDIYIDVHRNAADIEKGRDDVANVGGKRCARMFFVVGTGVGTYEGEYQEEPDWKANYTLALSVTEALRDIDPGLVLPIRTKVGRYNQHKGMCLLVEIGTNAITMEEALNSVPHFANALKRVIKF